MEIYQVGHQMLYIILHFTIVIHPKQLILIFSDLISVYLFESSLYYSHLKLIIFDILKNE